MDGNSIKLDPLQPDAEIGLHEFVLVTTLTDHSISISTPFSVTID